MPSSRRRRNQNGLKCPRGHDAEQFGRFRIGTWVSGRIWRCVKCPGVKERTAWFVERDGKLVPLE